MRPKTGVTVLGLVAVLATVGLEGSRALPLATSPVAATLRAHIPPASLGPFGDRWSILSKRPGVSGNLVVEVPRVVFIRPQGKWLFVTTNTGRAPERWDSFYYLAGGKSAVAGATLRDRVLAECGAGVR
jgi:hypothetical protein